jgi:hypothetical protein
MCTAGSVADPGVYHGAGFFSIPVLGSKKYEGKIAINFTTL